MSPLLVTTGLVMHGRGIPALVVLVSVIAKTRQATVSTRRLILLFISVSDEVGAMDLLRWSGSELESSDRVSFRAGKRAEDNTRAATRKPRLREVLNCIVPARSDAGHSKG